MTVSQTSLEAYHSLDAGELAATQAEIYYAISRNPYMSNRDLAKMLGREINTVTPRTNELLQMGYIERGDRKLDEVTGRYAYTYRIVRNEAEIARAARPTGAV